MKKIADINLLKSLGLDALPVADQEAMLLQIGDVIYESIISRVLGELKSKEKTDLDYMLTHNPTPEQIGEFMSEKVPHIDQIATEEIEAFKSIALKNHRKLVTA